MVERRRIAIVGAGPAGLSAARSLLSSIECDLTVFEKGRPPSNRRCPVDMGMTCSGCRGICNVVSGFGGSAHYGDAIKLSLLPAGRRLVDLFGRTRADALMLRALNFFQVSPGDAIPTDWPDNNVFSRSPFELRAYPVVSIDDDRLRRLIDQYLFYTKHRGRLLLRSHVDVIRHFQDKLAVEYQNSRGRHVELFDHVILAPGRAGSLDLRRFTKDLGLRSQAPNVSIGIRLELPNHLLLPFIKIHADLKLRIDNLLGYKIKTFCFCSGPTGGRVKFCNYPNQFENHITLLDGHINNYQIPEISGTGNMAFLAQLNDRESDKAWVHENIVRPYHEIADGSPIWQPFSQFYNAFHQDNLPDDIAGAPSVNALRQGQIDKLIPARLGHALSTAINEFLRVVARVASRPEREVIGQAKVLYPEIEFFWDAIFTDAGMMTSHDNLYVIGDGAGLAQGNLQAAMTGFAAAEAIQQKAESTMPSTRRVLTRSF